MQLETTIIGFLIVGFIFYLGQIPHMLEHKQTLFSKIGIKFNRLISGIFILTFFVLVLDIIYPVVGLTVLDYNQKTVSGTVAGLAIVQPMIILSAIFLVFAAMLTLQMLVKVRFGLTKLGNVFNIIESERMKSKPNDSKEEKISKQLKS